MQSTPSSPMKPSPLGFQSPRSSPFRRPESPSLSRSPSTATVRPLQTYTTPTSSPSRTPRANVYPPSPNPSVQSTIYAPLDRSNGVVKSGLDKGDPLSKLSATQVREMRESFQVLDRDNDGVVRRDDVVAMLDQIGLDASPASLAPYFPPSATSQTLNLSAYLTHLSSLLAGLSRPDELSAAFAAFDVDDSGQIDVAELREAMGMSQAEIDAVIEGFTGRRTIKKGTAGLERGTVFRYREFEAVLAGGAAGGREAEAEVGA